MGRYFTNRGGKPSENYRPILIGAVKGLERKLMFERGKKFPKAQFPLTSKPALPRPSGCPEAILEGRRSNENGTNTKHPGRVPASGGVPKRQRTHRELIQ